MFMSVSPLRVSETHALISFQKEYWQELTTELSLAHDMSGEVSK